jgi:hypothetical protein
MVDYDYGRVLEYLGRAGLGRPGLLFPHLSPPPAFNEFDLTVRFRFEGEEDSHGGGWSRYGWTRGLVPSENCFGFSEQAVWLQATCFPPSEAYRSFHIILRTPSDVTNHMLGRLYDFFFSTPYGSWMLQMTRLETTRGLSVTTVYRQAGGSSTHAWEAVRGGSFQSLRGREDLPSALASLLTPRRGVLATRKNCT